MYLLYSLAFGGLLASALPYFLYRSLREPGYGQALSARLSVPRLSDSERPVVWVHAVSVGEVLVAATLLPALAKELPDARFVVSVITATGREVAERALQGTEAIFFCPFDVAFLVRRVMRVVRPKALVVVETEIWPHLLREAKRAGAVTMIAGGRLSDRSYPRYRLIRGFMTRCLGTIDRLCMQNALYAERVQALGASAERIRVTGNVKFDALKPAPPAQHVARAPFPAGRKILIAGSTLEPEEKQILSVFATLCEEAPELFLVLAPRHPHRFQEVEALSVAAGFRTARRTAVPPAAEGADVMILDTLGELAGLYDHADLVFVGGSLFDFGGHNIIEPAAAGKPVLFGPHMKNFADVAELFVASDAAIQVGDRDELEESLRDLIRRPDRASKLGERALRVVAENKGASEKNARALRELLE